MTRDDQVAAHRALRQAVEDLARLARAHADDMAADQEPWRTHVDYPDRVAADLRRVAFQVELAGAELRRRLMGGRR